MLGTDLISQKTSASQRLSSSKPLPTRTLAPGVLHLTPHSGKSLNYMNYSSVQYNLINLKERASNLDDEYSKRMVHYETLKPDWSKSYYKIPYRPSEQQRASTSYITRNIRNVRHANGNRSANASPLTERPKPSHRRSSTAAGPVQPTLANGGSMHDLNSPGLDNPIFKELLNSGQRDAQSSKPTPRQLAQPELRANIRTVRTSHGERGALVLKKRKEPESCRLSYVETMKRRSLGAIKLQQPSPEFDRSADYAALPAPRGHTSLRPAPNAGLHRVAHSSLGLQKLGIDSVMVPQVSVRFADAEDERVLRATHSLDLRRAEEPARPNTSYVEAGGGTRSASSQSVHERISKVYKSRADVKKALGRFGNLGLFLRSKARKDIGGTWKQGASKDEREGEYEERVNEYANSYYDRLIAPRKQRSLPVTSPAERSEEVSAERESARADVVISEPGRDPEEGIDEAEMEAALGGSVWRDDGEEIVYEEGKEGSNVAQSARHEESERKGRARREA